MELFNVQPDAPTELPLSVQLFRVHPTAPMPEFPGQRAIVQRAARHPVAAEATVVQGATNGPASPTVGPVVGQRAVVQRAE